MSFPKIAEIYIFTNRHVLVFDEKGEQIPSFQESLSRNYMYDSDILPILESFIKDSPNIYIARWQDWKHQITLDEFCCLLGKGDWYFTNKTKIKTNTEGTLEIIE